MAEAHHEQKVAVAAALNAEAKKIWQFYTVMQTCEPYLSSSSVESVGIPKTTPPNHTASDTPVSEAKDATLNATEFGDRAKETGKVENLDVSATSELSVSDNHMANEPVDAAVSMQVQPTLEHAGSGGEREAPRSETAGEAVDRCQDEKQLSSHATALPPTADLADVERDLGGEQTGEAADLHCFKEDESANHLVANTTDPVEKGPNQLMQGVTEQTSLGKDGPNEPSLCAESTCLSAGPLWGPHGDSGQIGRAHV